MRGSGLLALALGALVTFAACSSETGAPPGPQATATPTFRKDVHPLLRESCALAVCHGTTANNLGLLVPEDPAAAFKELQKDSPTANGAKLVVPGDTAASFLMAKMDGEHASFQDKCLLPGCGDRMPPSGILGSAKRDVVRAWIKAGAKDD
ncbi:MAG: hypothetical protein KC657_17655 [Myxococcales bacterium]|nr:hypothetical protein [Myxococcales bacterium]